MPAADRHRHGACLLILALASLATVGQAAEVSDVQVTHPGKAYHVTATLVVDVPPSSAFAAATDFSAMARQAALIKDSRRIGPHRLKSTLSMCVLFYCRDITQVMDYRLTPPERIDMQVVPDAGDLKQGDAHWRLHRTDETHTRMDFVADMTPAFWVPPMLGGWAIAHALRGQIADTGAAIERVAAEQAGAATHPATGDDDAR